MKLSGFGKVLQLMYDDKMDVYRYGEYEEEDGSTSIGLSDKPIYNQIPCRISFVTTDNSEPTAEDINHLSLHTKIFCAATTDIKKGDKLVAYRLGDNGEILETYTGKASKPRQYASHKEISLEEVGEA